MKYLFSFIPGGLIVTIIAVIVILALIYLLVKNNKQKAYNSARRYAQNELVTALGGKDNIVSAKANGSRLSLVLKNYALIDESKVKQCGVSSILQMTNKVTLVIGEEAKQIEELITKQS